MGVLSGIQIASTFVLSSASPLDKKMMLTTTQRLDLDFVQRWNGMLSYDTDLGVWKKLINNPVIDITTETDWEDFGSGITMIVLSFEDFITKVFFDELETGKGYIFTYDLVGNGLRQFVFMANSENSSTGTYGINIHATIDGRILMEYYDENNDEIIEEIVFVLASGSQTTDTLVIEGGANTDPLILT